MARRKRNRHDRSFVMVPRGLLFRCEEWKSLGAAAKLLYIYIKGAYTGDNNGKINLYYSRLKGVRGLSSSATVSAAIKALEKAGFIERTKAGGLIRNKNEYRLTGKCDDHL